MAELTIDWCGSPAVDVDVPDLRDPRMLSA